VGAWLLAVALVYATIQQGAFAAGPFRVVLALVAMAVLTHLAARGVRPDGPRLAPVLAAPAVGSVATTVLLTDAGLAAALPTLALVAAVVAVIGLVGALRAEAVTRVVDAVVVGGLLAAATAWVGVTVHREPWGLVAQGIWRGSSTLTYANATGALVGIALLLALARLLRPAGRFAPLPAYGLGLGLASTGSRAALLSVAIGLLVLIRRGGWQPVARATVPVALGSLVGFAGLAPSLSATEPPHVGVAVAGLVLGAGLTVVLWTPRRRPLRLGVVAVTAAAAIVLVTAIGDDVSDLVDARFDVGSADRVDEWRAAVDELAASPVIGVGPGRLDLSWVGEDGRTYVAAFAHNEYLELLATYGVGGALALGACVVLVWRRRPRGPSIREVDGALAALAVLAAHSAFDFLWHIPVLPLVGAVLVGVLVGAHDPAPAPVAPPTHRELEPLP